MTDIEKFVRKISFIDFHIPGEKEELISKLRNILEFEQTKHREGLIELREANPPDLAEEVDWFSTEQNTRILFLERLIQLVQELPIVGSELEEPPESIGSPPQEEPKD